MAGLTPENKLAGFIFLHSSWKGIIMRNIYIVAEKNYMETRVASFQMLSRTGVGCSNMNTHG